MGFSSVQFVLAVLVNCFGAYFVRSVVLHSLYGMFWGTICICAVVVHILYWLYY